MAIGVATGLVYGLLVWCAIGLIAGLSFIFVGASRIDPAARDGTLGFRLLILPGSIALWPLLLKRWLGGRREPPAECNAHRKAAARPTQ